MEEVYLRPETPQLSAAFCLSVTWCVSMSLCFTLTSVRPTLSLAAALMKLDPEDGEQIMEYLKTQALLTREKARKNKTHQLIFMQNQVNGQRNKPETLRVRK